MKKLLFYLLFLFFTFNVLADDYLPITEEAIVKLRKTHFDRFGLKYFDFERISSDELPKDGVYVRQQKTGKWIKLKDAVQEDLEPYISTFEQYFGEKPPAKQISKLFDTKPEEALVDVMNKAKNSLDKSDLKTAMERQKQAVEILDEMIKQQGGGGGSGGGGGKSKPKPSSKKQGGQGKQSSSGSGSGSAPTMAQSNSSPGNQNGPMNQNRSRTDMEHTIWGMLKKKEKGEKDVINNIRGGGSFVWEYDEEIKEYFKRLAELKKD